MKQLGIVGFLIGVGLLLSTCTPSPTTVTVTVQVTSPPQVVTATPTATATPGPTVLTICQNAEPETLYLYGGAHTARHVLEAVYDGPIDYRSYDFQPVILEKLPRIEDGDAYFDTVTVQPGDRVIDIAGQPVALEDGVQVFANHNCLEADNPDCLVTFVGTRTLQLEQMVVSWQIPEGILWSDGEPVTADDSVYSYEMACDADTPASKYLCDRTASYVAAGERTVVWTGVPGYVDNLYFLNFFTPLPRHLWQDELRYTAANLLSRSESARQPMGWGPYVIVEWVQGEYIELAPNPNYFRAAEGLPGVDRLFFRFAASANDLVSMMLADQCDVGIIEGEVGDLMPLLISAQQQGLFNLAVAPSSDTWENLTFGINPVAAYDRPDFFEDARVRQAIAHCVDRQTMVDEVTFGLGEVADVYIPPLHPLYADRRLVRWPYDPAAGRALLTEVGWVDEDADGVLEADSVEGVRDGTVFRVDLLVMQGNDQQEALARIIRSNLADCGIQTNLVFTAEPDFRADGPAGPVFGRQFDLALFAWYNAVEPPCYLYLSEEIPNELNWGRSNAAGFSDAEYDAACSAALAALPGTYEYREFHSQAQRIFSEQLPSLPLFWRIRVAMAQPRVTGFFLDPSAESEMWGIEEIGVLP
ncbi:MAG: hypothetical protein JW900_02790 [Anaerolineae bacterium]|nr:hypothetical protein [Anaerolineae bacterium]